MAKDLQKKMDKAFEGVLDGKESIEYCLYGTIAPSLKKMMWSVIFSVAVLVVLVFLPIAWWWKFLILVIYLILLIHFYTKGVYIGKFGKRMYVYELDYFGNCRVCNSVFLKFVNFDSARSDMNSHVMLMFDIDDNIKYVVVKKEGMKLPELQSEMFLRLISDIEKKHR